MAMDLTAFDPVLKDWFGPKIVKCLNEEMPVMNLFKKSTGGGDKAGGRQVKYPAHVGRSPAVGAISESNTLPSPQNQETVEVKIPYRYTYGRIQFTTQTLKQSLSDRAAFAKSSQFEMEGIVNDLARDRSRSLFGWGVGILAYVNGQQTDNTTINIKSPGGVAYPSGMSTGAGRFILKNQYIVFVRNATPTSATDSDIVGAVGVKQVSSVSADGTSITLSATSGGTLNDNDMIVNASANVATESSVNKEIMGLLGMIDDGTYLTTYNNVSRTSYPQWKSTVINVNGILDLDTLQRAVDLQDEKGGKWKSTVLFSHHVIRREYLKQLMAQRRYVGEGVIGADGGFKGAAVDTDITYAGRPWKTDRFAPPGIIFGLDTAQAKRYLVTEGEWCDEDGSVLGRVLNKDSYEARFRIFDNLALDRPDTSIRLDGVSVTGTFDYAPVE